jgi:hypothetical protein
MPDEVLQEIAHSITWWLKAVSTSIDRHEAVLLNLCLRILALPYQDDGDTDRPVSEAINHPVGHVTQSLLNLWLKREPNDNETLPEDIEPIFTQLCDVEIQRFRHGRVLLASNLIALFRVDRAWTEKHLLPLFYWSIDATEAKAAWESFLWSPRLYLPLLIAFKPQFLETPCHYLELGEYNRQFTTFLTYMALDTVEGYTAQEFHAAIRELPKEGLQEVAQALSQAIESAGEQREDYWKNRIQPFWQHVWPKSRDLVSNDITEYLARMSISARGEFRSALALVLDWLQPIEYPHYIMHLLHESGLAKRFPEEALLFLDKIIDSQPWVPPELEQCLTVIAENKPDLTMDLRYRRLVDYSKRSGI